MLYFNLKEKRHYEKLNEGITTCLDFIKTNQLTLLKDGQHKLTEEISYNVLSFKTSSADKRQWEAHQQFIDIQTIIEGQERVDYQHLDKMEKGQYKFDEDFLPVEGQLKFSVNMERNDILILYPEDAHKTGITINEEKKIRKIVFKVKVTE
ncbi:MAG: YhcH/YjgK/YiaL family protein [Carnobacterium sp.]|uniref:YhcH/YjgK/YiaL family protein n=1 Tax=Carnobacterium sp. TaxID=48221 RepID=UPI003C739D9A